MKTLLERIADMAACVGGNVEDVLLDAAKEIKALRAKIEAMESRIELLEHDLKSGDYETLYAQTVVELAQIRKDADKFDDGIDWVQRALQAEARIEAMEKQEPVAWMSSRNGFICKENKNPDYNTPLYALPGAKGE